MNSHTHSTLLVEYAKAHSNELLRQANLANGSFTICNKQLSVRAERIMSHYRALEGAFYTKLQNAIVNLTTPSMAKS